MTARIDHLILPVNELEPSIEFYSGLLEFNLEGKQGPFDVVRVSSDFVILLTEFQTPGGFHLAFSFGDHRFDALFGKIKEGDVSYGDRFDQANNQAGPTPQQGAEGERPGIYLFDPSRHLIELRRE